MDELISDHVAWDNKTAWVNYSLLLFVVIIVIIIINIFVMHPYIQPFLECGAPIIITPTITIITTTTIIRIITTTATIIGIICIIRLT